MGLGAVMGSKNLKGIVAKGNKKIDLYEPEKFRACIKKWIDMLKAHPATGEFAPKYGTSGFLPILSAHNALPTKNFSSGSYKDADMISGQRLAETLLVKNSGCVSCPIRCSRVVNIDGKEVKGPEFEVLCLLGSNILCNDLDAIMRWNYQLDLLGVDSITVGNVIGFASELSEKGLWNSGIEFGKKDNIAKILEDIAYRRGIGNDLVEGVKYLFEKYGGKEFAIHVKGLEIPGYEPRADVGHGLGYATANRGGCHLDGGYMVYFEANGPMTLDPLHYSSKPGWVVLDQNLMAAISAGGNGLFAAWTFVPPIAYKIPNSKIISAIMRHILTYTWPTIDITLKLPKAFLGFHLPMLSHSKAIELATGMKMKFGDFLNVGERGYNLERLFNLREGITKEANTLPKRLTDEPQIPGQEKTKVPLSKMLPKYYRLRGWDKNGIPTKRMLKKLQLDDIVGSAV